MTKRKFYVVWEGHAPGIYDSWEECKEQVEGYPNAKYKSFESQTKATEAFRGSPAEHINFIKTVFTHPSDNRVESPQGTLLPDFVAHPEIRPDAIAVDGACAKNPGPMEYRGVQVATGAELFHFGPQDGGTNNIAEYLALIHVLAMLDKMGDTTTPVYSDSRTALAWLRNRGHKSKLERTPTNGRIFELLERADRWIQTHTPKNRVLKWDTDSWGEIPADFGRK